MFSAKRVKNLIVKDFVSSSKIVLTITVGLIFLELLQLVVPYLRYSSYSHLDVVWRSGLFNVSALWVVTVGIIPFTEYSKSITELLLFFCLQHKKRSSLQTLL